MILEPGVLALLASSLLTAGLLLHASRVAILVLRRWDLASESALQLELERRTVLVSALVGWALAFEAASLFLFVHVADAMAPLFTGAMCAAGTLQATPWGMPALAGKLLAFTLAGTWLVLNHADGLAPDYPLVRQKYLALLALAPLVVAEGALQALHFASLEPDVITSCCGSLFGARAEGFGAGLAGLPAGPTAVTLYGVVGAAIAGGIAFRRTGRGAGLLAAGAALALPVGLAAIVAFVSPYVYELPAHHCPFCLLQGEYGGIGYPLYGALLGGVVAGAGVGVVAPFGPVESLREALPRLQRRLAGVAIVLLSAFLAIATVAVAASGLRG